MNITLPTGGKAKAIAVLVAIIALIYMATFAIGFVNRIKAEYYRDKAIAAAEMAKYYATRAQQSEDSHEVTTQTHRNIDTIRVETINRTESAAQRIEAKADANPHPATGTVAVPDDDFVRDIAEAEARYRAAADRLRNR